MPPSFPLCQYYINSTLTIRVSTELNLVLIAVSIPTLSLIMTPGKFSSSSRSGSLGKIVINSFNYAGGWRVPGLELKRTFLGPGNTFTLRRLIQMFS